MTPLLAGALCAVLRRWRLRGLSWFRDQLVIAHCAAHDTTSAIAFKYSVNHAAPQVFGRRAHAVDAYQRPLAIREVGGHRRHRGRGHPDDPDRTHERPVSCALVALRI